MADLKRRSLSSNITTEAPFFPTIGEGGLRAFYANEINVIETPKETLIDFSLVSPTEYFFDEDGSPSAKISHELVVRCFLPSGAFAQFVASYLRNHPDIVQEYLASQSSEEA